MILSDYQKEVAREAVRLNSAVKAASRHGLHRTTVSRWVRVMQGKSARPVHKKPGPSIEKIGSLLRGWIPAPGMGAYQRSWRRRNGISR